ncbi:MAG: hypothetical protein P4L92_02375 [Rudaea sp.]|nr:hypothetical protein [Rudaea sp.]
MNSKIKLVRHSCLLLLMVLFAACATPPTKHPAYLHALSDLRAARWMLEHRPGDAAVSTHEDEAINEIDHAIAEIKKAAIDDGKDIHYHPDVDLPRDRPGRLHRAAELLRQVRADTGREEDDPSARGLRNRAMGHVDAALHATERAIHDVEFGR